MYEARGTRPASRAVFLLRFAGHFALAALVVVGSLGAGMWGYERYEHLAWRDAFLNAAMLLGGDHRGARVPPLAAPIPLEGGQPDRRIARRDE